MEFGVAQVQLADTSVLALMGGQVSVAYLLSARDASPQTSDSVLRAQRAAANLLETLPAFLVLAVLSTATKYGSC